MSYISKNILKNINAPHKHISKENNQHSQSPNVRPIYNPQKPIKNNLFPKKYNNHNINPINGNIQVNLIRAKKDKEKGKIIEGDLNFNEVFKPSRISSNNTRPKHPSKMPRKSPVPIPRSFKPQNFLNFNRFFSSKPNYGNNNNIRPNTQNYTRPKNLFQPQIPNNGLKNNTNISKSFNSLNILKKDRSHSPILRTGQNKAIMSLGLKPNNNKNRYVSKSPILGKGSSLARKANFGFNLVNKSGNLNNNLSNNMNNLNSNIQQKKVFKKSGPQGSKRININSNNSKKNTVISGDMFQGNINNMKPIQNRINNNVNLNNNNNHNENININNILLKNRNEINQNQIQRPINKNIPQNKEDNINNNVNKIKDIKNIKVDLNNNISDNPEIKPLKEKEIKDDTNINSNQNINKDQIKLNSSPNLNIPSQETKDEKPKKNTRSQSQGPIDPLKRNEDKEIRPQKIQEKKEKEITPKKVIKKIKDLLPYTHVGFDGEEPKENNQDNYFIFKNFADQKDYIYLSVCDGHGVEGHFVSEFIKEVLPYYMSENLKGKNILTDTKNVHQIISDIFVMVNNLLVDNESINSLFSGSTCVSVIYTPERLIVPNIGDSRAVLGRYDFNTKTYKAIDLSRDHKPTEKDEAKRIIDNDGRIQPFTEEGEFVGPQRVWIKDEEVPGLAMTRSFGDRVAATVGVMSEPEIKEFNFEEGDKFMIIASDGIWEFISSQECVEIVSKYYEKGDLKGCCEYLYEESSKRWLKEEEVIDDTTLILVYFE
jgi:serine/threonine protein phosphatase PrpC